jgi:hypothetical protein
MGPGRVESHGFALVVASHCMGTDVTMTTRSMLSEPCSYQDGRTKVQNAVMGASVTQQQRCINPSRYWGTSWKHSRWLESIQKNFSTPFDVQKWEILQLNAESHANLSNFHHCTTNTPTCITIK